MICCVGEPSNNSTVNSSILVVFNLCIPFSSQLIHHLFLQTCPIEYGHVFNIIDYPQIEWNAENAISSDFPDIIEAKPLCLDGHKKNRVRHCDSTTAKWTPIEAPYCHHSQLSYDRSKVCPLNYQPLVHDGKLLCFLITPPQPWSEQCLSDGSSNVVYDLTANEKAELIKMLSNFNVSNVWMPAKRITAYGPVIWRVAGELFGETVEFDKINIDLVNERNVAVNGCLSTSAEHNFEMGAIQNCDMTLPTLCLYRFDAESSLSQICSSNGVTVAYRYDDNKLCYSLRTYESDQQANILKRNGRAKKWIQSQCAGDLFSMETMDKTRIFQSLSEIYDLNENNRCLFAVHPDNGYVANESGWNEIAHKLDYVNWDYPTSNNGTMLTVDRRGKWNFANRKIDCIACQHPIELHTPELVLSFDKRKRRLYLTIYDEEYLWRKISKASSDRHRDHKPSVKCFTNADAELVRNVEIIKRKWHGILGTKHLNRHRSTAFRLREKSKAIYELRLYGDGSGYYWCEGYTIFSFDLIRSAKVVAFRRDSGDVYAMLANVRCEHCETLFLAYNTKSLAKRFREHLKETYKSFKKIASYQQRFGQTDVSIENVRLMQIDNIFSGPSGEQYATVLFHVTLALIKIDKSLLKGNISISTDHWKIFRMLEIFMEMLQASDDDEFLFKSMNSTEICLPDNLYVMNGLNWISAKIGETQPPDELCLLSNGLPVLRSCIGDFLYGGVWLNRTLQQCYRPPKPITKKLFEIYKKLKAYNKSIDSQNNETRDTYAVISTVSKMLETQSSHDDLLAADVFYVGQIMNDVFRLNNNNSQTTLNLNDTEHIFTIYNRLMYLNESTIRKSAALNSTNILLDAFDNIINGIPMNITSATMAIATATTTTTMATTTTSTTQSTSNASSNTIVDADTGIVATITPNLIVYVIDPFVRNVSGVALIKKHRSQHQQQQSEPGDDVHRDDFTDYIVRLLYANQSSDELLHDANLEIATYVPMDMLQLLNETRAASATSIDNDNNSNNSTDSTMTNDTQTDDIDNRPQLKIVISIYYNDRLFTEYRNATNAKPSGKIISVSIPGFESNLPALLPIFMRTERPSDTITDVQSEKCGYWNFDDDLSRWSHDGCELGAIEPNGNDSAVALCVCSHLTHYSYLIVGTFPQPLNADEDLFIVTRTHQKALDTITLLGCLLSLLGVCGIAITAAVFRTWREKASSIVLLQLSAAIAMQMILLCFVNTEYSSEYLIAERRINACIALGALLQYSILVAFSWMLISAYLQYMRYVKVIGAMRSTRFFLKSFLIGWLTPMLPVVVVIIVAPHSYVRSVESSTTGGICYPSGASLYFGLILPIGVIIFANLVVFLLVIHNILSSKSVRPNKRDLAMAQFRLSVFLFFLLGLSWIFGFLASFRTEIVFSYLFCLTATIQGFVLFVYFIILDPNTRKLWRDFFDKIF